MQFYGKLCMWKTHARERLLPWIVVAVNTDADICFMRSFCVCGACVCSCDLIGVCILYNMAGGEGMGGGGGEQ